MDGGGNDILLLNRQCLTVQSAETNASCVSSVASIVSAAKALLSEMAADGVEDVVYFFYPDVPVVTGDMLSYAEPLVAETCLASATPSCHFIDTRPTFQGMTAQYILPDGIHPTVAGAQVIADLIWQTMVDNCVAQ